jgi:hypothetical protein
MFTFSSIANNSSQEEVPESYAYSCCNNRLCHSWLWNLGYCSRSSSATCYCYKHRANST